MNILFITSSRIGDAVLSTGLLDYIARKYPNAKVWIACGPLAMSLFKGYPNLEDSIPIQKQPFNLHWLKFWSRVAGRKWDMVVDLRNSAVSRLVWAKKRHVFSPHIDKALHKARQCAAVMKLSEVPAPRLWFTEEQIQNARQFVPQGSLVLAVGPTANWAAKTWSAERFVEVIEWIRSEAGPLPGCRVAVFAAPGEEEGAQQVLQSVPEEARIDVIAKADPGTAAAAISLCDFYLGNDSGLMHCAAASGIKTLGLFGPSYPSIYSPWGQNYIATPESFDELIGYAGYSAATAPCLMGSLSAAAVIQKIKDIF